MRSIEDVRKDISSIDLKMRNLFIERLNYVKEMKEIKISNDYSFVDKKREEDMKSFYTEDLQEYKDEYLELLEKILEISKKQYK